MTYELRGSGEVGKTGALRSRLIPFRVSALFGRRALGPDSPAPGTVGALTRYARALSPVDRIAVAHDALRKSLGGALCVAFGGRIIGMLTLNALNRSLSHPAWSGTSQLAAEPLSLLLAGPEPVLTIADVFQIAESEPLTAARSFFEEQPDAPLIGIVNAGGAYVGILLRADLVSADLGNLTPARVGGMATPLGVYLTDGIVQGGAGNLGLALTGASMSALFFVASMATNYAFLGLERQTGFDLTRILALTFMSLSPGDVRIMAEDITHVLAVPIMLVLLRLVPIAGFHAAEHQTVHAMERGEPLVPDTVKRMPRAHPRCGTNLVAAVCIFNAAMAVMFGMTSSIIQSVVPAIIITITLWRPVGTFLQNYLTTRPASPRQIESGIRAGKQVMERFISGGIERNATVFQRIWNMGLVQIMIGAYALVAVIELVGTVWPAAGRVIDGIGF
jgi:hypothetical protein